MIKPPQDEVDRAALGMDRAIHRLIALLGSQDRATINRAALALDALGARAIVGPLGSALPRAKQSIHRLAILGMLRSYVEVEQGQVAAALARIVQRERDPQVMMVIRQITAQMAFGEITGATRPGVGAANASSLS